MERTHNENMKAESQFCNFTISVKRKLNCSHLKCWSHQIRKLSEEDENYQTLDWLHIQLVGLMVGGKGLMWKLTPFGMLFNIIVQKKLFSMV